MSRRGWNAASWGCRAWANPARTSTTRWPTGSRSSTCPGRRSPLKLDVIRSKVWSGRPLLELTPQIIPKTQFHQAILDGAGDLDGAAPRSTRTSTISSRSTPIPSPKEEGGSEVHMLWMDNPCRSTCWNNSMESIQAFRSPKLETHRGAAPLAGERHHLRRHHPARQHQARRGGLRPDQQRLAR